jgi:hypothetical protein
VDTKLFARVLWRFRWLVAAGAVLAVALAALAFVRVDFEDGGPTFTYRDAEQWESLATVFVTSRGFPWGSITPTEIDSSGKGSTAVDPGYLTTLAAIYRQLATGDGVRRLMLDQGPVDGAVQTFPVYADNGNGQLPLITLSAIASSPAQAENLSARYLDAFLAYMRQQQDAGNIDPDKRVQFEVVRQPQPAELLQGRSKTLPILVFLAVMTCVVGLAFVLENTRPRIKPVSGDAQLPTREPQVPGREVQVAGREVAGREVTRRSA